MDNSIISINDINDSIIDNKCIIIINNNVYNITEYLRKHPGGEDILLNLNGKDATDEFNDIGHSNGARNILEKYKIGTLLDADKTKIRGDKKIATKSQDGVSLSIIISSVCILSIIGFITVWMVNNIKTKIE